MKNFSFSSMNFGGLMEGLSQGKTYRQLLEISDEAMQEFYAIAQSYAENKQYEEAADCFLFLSSLEPMTSNLWLRLGNAEQGCGHYEEALDAYSMAMMCDADDPFPHLYSVEVYLELKQHDLAQECLNVSSRLIEENLDGSQIKDLIKNLQNKINASKGI